MKKINVILCLAILASVVVFSSCEDEKVKVKGCNDPLSENYNPKAEENDGSCRYKGEVVFYYGKTTAEWLAKIGVKSLTFYVDGKIVGSYAANIYVDSSTPPKCGENATVTVSKDLGHVKTQSYSYSVQDENNRKLWEGTINFNAKTCSPIKLVTKN